MYAIKEASLLLLILFLLPAQRWIQMGILNQQATPEPPAIRLSSPLPGEALQGQVTVTGATQVDRFQSAEISFGYQDDRTNTWFLLQQSSTGVADGDLALWDTTTISDGVYRLRLQVFLNNGQVLETVIEGLRVRNYSPVETSTPAMETPATAVVRVTATHTPLADFHPPDRTPVALPTNPARLTVTDLRASLAGGISVVLGALVLAVVYTGIKTIFRR